MRTRAGRVGLLGALLSLALAAPAAAITPTITEYSNLLGPTEKAPGITTGSDGNMWLTLTTPSSGAIARLTAGGVITRFTSGLSGGSRPLRIASGPDGNLWFTDPGVTAIGRITTDGAIQEFTTGLTPGTDSPSGITAGPDGNVWFADQGTPAIGQITPAGAIHKFSTGLPTGSSPTGIAAGPDGNLWFTDPPAHAIGRITPAGAIHEFSGAALNPGSALNEITAGPDGNLWFTDDGTQHAIGRITTSGQITEFSTGLNPNPNLANIVEGPDGALWFSDEARALGRVLTSGSISEFSAGLGTGSSPSAIALGPDGNMWFSDGGTTPAIGTITTPPTATTVSASATGATTAAILALVDGHAQPTTFHIEYGIPGGSLISTKGQSLGITAGPTHGSAALSGLRPGTTYEARVIGANPTDSATGDFLTFTTGPAPDRISRMTLRPKVFVAATRGGPVRAARAPGALISYTGSQPATTTFTIQHAVQGRRSGRNCVKRTRKNRSHRACTRWAKIGRFRHSDRPGKVRFRFTGRLHNRTLRPGSYLLRAEPHSAGGIGHVVQKHFGVKAPPHKHKHRKHR